MARKRRLVAKEDDTPKVIKPYNFFNADMRAQSGSDNWVGDCPLCGAEGKFYANKENGLFDCKVCGESGNNVSFMNALMKHLGQETPQRKLKGLCRERGTVRVAGEEHQFPIPAKIMTKFGLAWDQDAGAWLIPCMARNGNVRNIRRYKFNQMRAVAGMDLYIGGLQLLNRKMKRVWLMEGEWDAIAMAMLLDMAKINDGVVWVPGCNTLKDKWVNELSRYDVICAYDNDNAGELGQQRVYRKGANIISSLRFVNWPDTLPNKFDVRDLVIRSLEQGKEPLDVYDELMALASEKPKRWKEADDDKIEDKEKDDEKDLEEATLSEVMTTFDEFVLMDEQMRMCLRVMLAVTMATDITGDPLWLYVVGPPGAGKTLLLSSLQKSRRCQFVSTVSPHSLVSGWQTNGGKDPSLIPKLKGRTFVAKDWTEVLAMPGPIQEEIFSTLRGAYDGFVQKPFGNGVMREYTNCFFSILAGVTNAIHGNSKASLGERFLKFQLNVKKENKNEIVQAALLNIGREKTIEKELQYVVKRFLKKKVGEDVPLIPVMQRDRIVALVELVALLRSQVERDWRGDRLLYRPVPEAGTRLAKQLGKLAVLLAVVDGDNKVTDKQMEVVEKVAYDTAYGFHLDIISTMMEMGGEGTKSEISEAADLPHSTLALKIDDLLLLKAIHKLESKKSTAGGGRPATVFKVSDEVATMWLEARGHKPWQPKKKRSRRQKKLASS